MWGKGGGGGYVWGFSIDNLYCILGIIEDFYMYMFDGKILNIMRIKV